MELTVRQCRAILETLPIGYYCGRRIPVKLKEDIPTSYYVPTDDAIFISFPIIHDGVAKIDDESKIESAVRSMLYHELSHAILTPTKIVEICSYNKRMQQIINVFEDERIETLLSDYYRDVDFKEQLFNITGGPTLPANDDMQRFFNAVRFRIAPDNVLHDLANLIEKYSNMNRASNSNTAYNYYYDVRNFWSKYFDSGKEEENNQTSAEEDFKEMTDGDFQQMQEAIKKAFKEGKIEVNTDAIRERAKKSLSPLAELEDSSRGELETVMRLQRTLEVLFANFNKKSGGGNGMCSYSGVFNPRQVRREDYRFFERSVENYGNNRFGSINLNLFLDRSGSFEYNEGMVNGLLSILTAIERRNKNFKMNVYFINDKFFHCKKSSERIMKCQGGNRLPDNIHEIVRKAQKTNTYNYNIVLFDGDAFSDSPYGRAKNIELFRAFDRKQTTLITDYDNVDYMGKGFTSARVIVTRNYTDELVANLEKAFKTMLS